MVEIRIDYQGQLHCVATHGPSGTAMTTDAPADNMGKGESFSPTDLLATSLGTCILTTMGIVAQRHNIDMSSATATVIKEMVTQPHRRVGKLTVTVRMPPGIAVDQRQRLENAAHACPVHRSLHPDVQAPISIEWR
jgi:putative redox protein